MNKNKPSNKKNPKTSSLNEKLDLILKNQSKILKNERKILGKEDKIEELELKELENDIIEIKDDKAVLNELSNLEKKLKKSISNPIKSITQRDLVKGSIGAFVGVVSHFSFSKAIDVSLSLNFYYSTTLYIVAFIIIVAMLYYSGFRDVKKKLILSFVPLRAVVLYSVSIFTVILVYALFGKIHLPIDFFNLYKIVSASIILAVMGAGTADLIGKAE